MNPIHAYLFGFALGFLCAKATGWRMTREPAATIPPAPLLNCDLSPETITTNQK